MGIKTVHHRPYSPDLALCDFWLFPKLRGCRYETIEEMKEAMTKVIDTLTRGLPWGLREVVGTVQVHCSRRGLLRRRLELPKNFISNDFWLHSVYMSGSLLFDS